MLSITQLGFFIMELLVVLSYCNYNNNYKHKMKYSFLYVLSFFISSKKKGKTLWIFFFLLSLKNKATGCKQFLLESLISLKLNNYKSICLTLWSLLQYEHFEGTSLFNKYPWVSLMCPIQHLNNPIVC